MMAKCKPPDVMTPTELRDERETLGMTQTEIATLCGVGLRAWQHYEAGERHIPSPIRRLVRLLERPLVRHLLARMEK